MAEERQSSRQLASRLQLPSAKSRLLTLFYLMKDLGWSGLATFSGSSSGSLSTFMQLPEMGL